jgi:hypothetical protein
VTFASIIRGLLEDVARIREKRIACGILVAKPEETPLGRQRRRWVDIIKMGLKEIAWGGMYWIELTQDRD